MAQKLLADTPILDYRSVAIQALICDRQWACLPVAARIGAAYDFVRNEILFGYNTDDALPASRVLADGYGQCNTKATLLMALLRALQGLCCINSVRDSLFESSVVAGGHEQLVPYEIQN